MGTTTLTTLVNHPKRRKTRKPRPPPSRCDLCHTGILDKKWVTGPTRFGLTHTMCIPCNREHGADTEKGVTL